MAEQQCWMCEKTFSNDNLLIQLDMDKTALVACPYCGVSNILIPQPHLCFYCHKDLCVGQDFEGDTRCPHCQVENSIFKATEEHNNNQAACKEQDTCEEWLKEEEEMGSLKDRARERSPFIRLAIGESTPPMIYKSWKEITGTFGDSFRYLFEVETDKGLVQKTFDCPQQKFAEEMDAIPFGAKVVIHRKQKMDGNNNPIENKSIYEITEVRE